MGNLQTTSKCRQETIQNHGSVAFEHLSEALRHDAEIALALIRNKRQMCDWNSVSSRLRSNKGFVMTAVQETGLFLRYASEELRSDRDIVLEAVRQDGNALLCVSEELRADREIVMAAVGSIGYAFLHASEELHGDREIAVAALSAVNPQDLLRVLATLPNDFFRDREIVLAALGTVNPQDLGRVLANVPNDFQWDREIVLAALNTVNSRDLGRVLANVSDDLKNDPMVASAILRKAGRLQRGSEIMERLEHALLTVRTLPEASVKAIVDEESLFEFCMRLEHSIWQKIWVVIQLRPCAMIDDIARLIVEQSGLLIELRQAKELFHCAPVIGAVLSVPDQWRDWRDIYAYPVRRG